MELNLKLITLFESDENVVEGSKSRRKSIQKKLKTLSYYISSYGLVTIKMINTHHVHGLLLAFNHAVFSLIQFDSNMKIISVHHDDSICSKLNNRRISNIRITDKLIVFSFIEATLAFVSIEKVFKKGKFRIVKESNPLKWINFERFCNRHTKRSLEVRDNIAVFWWNTALLTKWTAPTTKSIACPPNLIVFNLDSSSILATETIYGEIIKNDFIDVSKFGLLYRATDSCPELNYVVYEICPVDPESRNIQLAIIFEVTIPLLKSCIYAEFTSLQDKILLLCDDESVMLFNIEQNVLYSLHSSIPVCFLASNPLDAIFATSNEYGRLSLYDYAFNNLTFTFDRPSSSGSKHDNEIMTSPYDQRMSIKRLEFLGPDKLAVLLVDNKQQNEPGPRNKASNCCLALVHFPYRLDMKRLMREYLFVSKFEETINMLRVINWNCAYEDAYYCLNTVFQYLLKLPFSQELEAHIESTLATFLIPCTPIDHKIFEQILPYIRHLAIRFFYYLVRNASYDNAYRLAIELKSRRMFLFLHEICRQHGKAELADLAYRAANCLNI